ncbi:hypothetical protein LAZ67_8003990 [Cordylochernes scorpioides]|uniref:Secreted protein n=1 Tax=Cordylochernes scorpioides TaxID=51811 RepID=A0ABY6KS12_9ARAC|nr:hypothetical protein LAZ67_8003990 [Cordylochernes scorpioides]
MVELVFCMKMVIITPTMGLWLAHRHAGVWLDTGGVRSSTIGRWLDFREGAYESFLDSGLWPSRPRLTCGSTTRNGCLSPSQTSLVGPGHPPQVRWLDHRKGISVSGSVLPRLKVASGSISTPRNHQRKNSVPVECITAHLYQPKYIKHFSPNHTGEKNYTCSFFKI